MHVLRHGDELRRGSRVRGAIDLVAIARELDAMGSHDGDRTRLVLDAAPPGRRPGTQPPGITLTPEPVGSNQRVVRLEVGG